MYETEDTINRNVILETLYELRTGGRESTGAIVQVLASEGWTPREFIADQAIISYQIDSDGSGDY